MADKINKVILIIRDGYGHRDYAKDNAPAVANTKFTDMLMEKYPTTLLRTSGNDVGLPENNMGGSEVGHFTIGSGRITFQSLERINRAIKDNSFFENEAFLGTIRYVKEHNTKLHLIGLLQTAGVHSHQEHLFALMKMARDNGLRSDQVYIHIISDGRDAPPRSVKENINDLRNKIFELGTERIATIVGRYYAMDRDKRWERTKKAYDLYVSATGERFNDIIEAVEDAYQKNENDEFIKPRVVGDYPGIQENDGLIFFNFRYDRMRQITQSFLEKNFDDFERHHPWLNISVMQEYYKGIPAPIAFRTEKIKNLLADVVADNNLKQLRISETEKYAHVTYFFNAQQDEVRKNEDRILIPSPREVATYDKKPEMSIYKVTDKLIENIEKDEYSLIVVNFVNGDMVGHTGVLDATVSGVEAIDKCLERTVKVGLEKDYTFLIFADHGNCEEMSGEHQTSHTLNDVDLILVSNDEKYQKDKCKLKYGGLKDIAPTTLRIMNLPIPKEMTGEVLFE